MTMNPSEHPAATPHLDLIRAGAARWRARMAARGRSILGMYRCGLHSGFPRCCIRFFVDVWFPAMEVCGGLDGGAWDILVSDLDEPINGRPVVSPAVIELRRWAKQHFHAGNEFDYIPCSACVDRPPVQTRECWRPEGRSRCELVPAGTRKTYRKQPDGTWRTLLQSLRPLTCCEDLPGES